MKVHRLVVFDCLGVEKEDDAILGGKKPIPANEHVIMSEHLVCNIKLILCTPVGCGLNKNDVFMKKKKFKTIVRRNDK